MKPIEILAAPWAILPNKLYEIQEVYKAHLRGEKLSSGVLTAMQDQPGFGQTKNYQVINDIAIIPIQGVIAKRMNLFTDISGGVSSQLVARDLLAVLSNEKIRGVILDIDSPGGTVDGTQELADIVFEGRAVKPIVAYTDGMMASAAYWIGTAAHRIYISGDTNPIGSIGVVAAHVDYSAYEEKRGIKTTEIYAGKYKRIASQYKPLSKEGKQSIQDEVDYIYSIFVDEVAKQRGVNTDKVLQNMADGKIFIGQQSVQAGLVDGVLSFDEVISERIPLLSLQYGTSDLARLEVLNNSLRGA